MKGLTETACASTRRSINPLGRNWVVLWIIFVTGVFIVRGAGQLRDADALYLAVTDGDLARFETELARLPHLDARDHLGYSPLALAASFGLRDAVEVLPAKGASVDVGNPRLGTPLMLALGNGHEDVARMLLARGADVNARCDGFDPLLGAVWSDRLACVELVLEAGADVNREGRRYNPLTLAVQDEHADVLRRLLDAGVDPNVPDEEGTRPLCEAVARRSTCATRLLLRAGSDPDRAGPDGLTPRDAAREWGCREVLELMDAANK